MAAQTMLEMSVNTSSWLMHSDARQHDIIPSSFTLQVDPVLLHFNLVIGGINQLQDHQSAAAATEAQLPAV